MADTSKDNEIHIRQDSARWSMGSTIGIARQRMADFFEFKRAHPNFTYCTADPAMSYESVDEALAAGVPFEKLCPHCAGWDLFGIGCSSTFELKFALDHRARSARS